MEARTGRNNDKATNPNCSDVWTSKWLLKVCNFLNIRIYSVKPSYLNQKYDEKVEVGHSPELLKHILGDEVPKRVLENMNKWLSQKEKQKTFCTNKEIIFQWLRRSIKVKHTFDCSVLLIIIIYYTVFVFFLILRQHFEALVLAGLYCQGCKDLLSPFQDL